MALEIFRAAALVCTSEAFTEVGNQLLHPFTIRSESWVGGIDVRLEREHISRQSSV